MAEQVRNRNRPVDQREVKNAVYRCTPAGTSEIAEIIGVARQTADYHLQQLEEDDRIWSKKIGPTRVWIHPRVMRPP